MSISSLKIVKRNKLVFKATFLVMVLGFVLLGMIGQVRATTYYVDASNGADNNNGTATGTAWKTIAKVNSSVFVAGDDILFKRGEVWRDQLNVHSSGSENNYITFGAYGTGEKPKILGSIPWNNPDQWINEGGNIWSTQNTGQTKDVGNIIFNNTDLTGNRKRTIDLVQAQGDFFYDPDTSEVKLYSTSNPASYYSNIELVLKQNGISVGNKSFIKINNFQISNVGWIGINGDSGTHDIILSNNDISYIGGCASYSGAQTYSPFIRAGNGIQFWNSSHDILVENNRLWEIYDAALTTQGSGVAQVYNHTYRNNVIWNSEYGYELWHRPAETTAENIRIENNTIVDSGLGWAHNQRPDSKNGRALMIYYFPAQKSNISIKYNVFVNATESLIRFNNSSDISNVDIDKNYYVNSIGLFVAKYGGSIQYQMSQSAQWISAENKDANSIFSTEANLANYATGDYRLASNNAAIDRGEDTGRTTDILGNPIIGLPDMGAYEFQSSSFYNLANLTQLFSDWLKTKTSTADINFDGKVNSRDLGIMLSNWSR